MKLSLNLEFDSVAEMQDWIVQEAQLLHRSTEIKERAKELQEGVGTPIAFEPAPEPKPKRKRRTKAEMAAARAAEAQAAAEPEPVPEPEPVTEAGVELGTEPEPPAEVEATGSNGSGELQKRFMALMAKDPHAAVAELDRVVGPSGKFSQCAVEVQREILAVLEGRQ